MGQFKFILWLAYWYLQCRLFEFEWDHGNSVKSTAKHGTTCEEVESVFNLRRGIPIGSQVSPKVDEERFCIVGPTLSGKLISIVFTLRDGKVRPISSRPSNKKEKNIYEETRKALKNLRKN